MGVKTKAVLESVAVLVVTLAAIGVFTHTPLKAWEEAILQRNLVEYALMIAIPLLILALTRRSLPACGLTFAHPKYHLDIALTCSIPYSLYHAAGSFVKLGEPWDGVLSTALAGGLLVVCAWLLRNKPSPGAALAAGALLLGVWSAAPSPGRAASALVFYTLFLGPGEEVLFRGYIQSRLNQAFGRPFRLGGVPWGWGTLITAALFGLFHVVNLPHLYQGAFEPLWWSGLSSAAVGLVLGYLREKTGSILAPAILHGLPQAIAWAYLGL